MRSFILATLLMVVATSAHSRELVIAVSPYQSPEQAKAQAVNVLKFLAALEPGDRATLIDGFALTTVGHFDVPTDAIYNNNPRARLAVNRTLVAAYMAFAQHSALPVAGQGSQVQGALRWPQLLDMIARTLTPPAGSDILLLGSPVYDTQEDQTFSMVANRFPSDGHVNAKRSDSIYGTRDNSQALNGMRIHLAHEATPSLRVEQYRLALERLWILYVERLGGKQVTFTNDLKSLFRRVTDHAAAPPHSYKLDDSRRMQMLRLSPALPQATIFKRPLSQQPLASLDIRHAEKMEVGLSWNCAACDLDLHARAHPGAQILYYGRADSAEGHYWHDFVHSPRSTGGFETITYSVPIDLNTATIVVNFFSGNAPAGIRAELRVSVNGQTFAGLLNLPAGHGNTGADVRSVFEHGQNSATTRVIDLLEIVNPEP